MSDLISRQAAIDAIEEYADRLQMANWKENPGVPYKAYALNWCIDTIRDLPSAQPTQTNTPNALKALDCVSRQAAIRWVKTECNPYGKPTLEFESGKKVIEHLEQMPAAEPEIIRCEDCMHNGSFDTDCPIGWNGKEYCSFAERRTDD